MAAAAIDSIEPYRDPRNAFGGGQRRSAAGIGVIPTGDATDLTGRVTPDQAARMGPSDSRALTVQNRPNFTIPPTQTAQPAPPSTALATRPYQPNFTMGGGQPVTDIGAAPEAPGWRARFNAAVPSADIGEPVGRAARAVGGAITNATGKVLQFAGKASPWLAAGGEAISTGRDVMTDGMTGLDKTARVAEGVSRAAGATAGGLIGGAVGSAVPVVGTAIGGLLGGAAGFVAPDAANWIYNKVTGSDNQLPSDKADSLRAAQDIGAAPPQHPVYSDARQGPAIPVDPIGGGRGVVNFDPQAKERQGTALQSYLAGGGDDTGFNPANGKGGGIDRRLPTDLSALQPGNVYKTIDPVTGRPVYSGRDVKENAGIVDKYGTTTGRLTNNPGGNNFVQNLDANGKPIAPADIGSPNLDSQLSDARQAAAARGDWGAVGQSYGNQPAQASGGIGGLGSIGIGTSSRDQWNAKLSRESAIKDLMRSGLSARQASAAAAQQDALALQHEHGDQQIAAQRYGHDIGFAGQQLAANTQTRGQDIGATTSRYGYDEMAAARRDVAAENHAARVEAAAERASTPKVVGGGSIPVDDGMGGIKYVPSPQRLVHPLTGEEIGAKPPAQVLQDTPARRAIRDDASLTREQKIAKLKALDAQGSR